MTNASIMPAVGWDPNGNRIEVVLYNRTGNTANVGEHVMLDIGATDGDVTALASAGAADSPWANFVDPAVTDNNVGIAGIFGIVLEEITNDSKGLVMLRGLQADVKVDGATAVGTALICGADGTLDVAAATGQKVIGLSLMADAPTGYATVYFDGINGLGTDK